jgi:hypothetical protein
MGMTNEDRQEPLMDVINLPDGEHFTPTTWESDWIDIGGEG